MLSLAVIVAVPYLTAVTLPVLVTVATAVLLELHVGVPLEHLAVRVIEEPLLTVADVLLRLIVGAEAAVAGLMSFPFLRSVKSLVFWSAVPV